MCLAHSRCWRAAKSAILAIPGAGGRMGWSGSCSRMGVRRHPYTRLSHGNRMRVALLCLQALALSVSTAPLARLEAQAHPQLPNPPSQLVQDPFWSLPLSYLDHFLIRAKDNLSESLSWLLADSTLAVHTRPPIEPDYHAYYDPRTDRVTLDVTFSAATFRGRPRELCALTFETIRATLGVHPGLPPFAQSNLFSHFLPPSASVVPPSSRDSARVRLFQQTDLYMVLLEMDTKTTFSCRQPLLAAPASLTVEQGRFPG